MCGIIGYCGREAAGSIVLDALKRLEYRGYDSVGVASIHNGTLLIKKDAGEIEKVHQKLNLSDLPGSTALGHTRWATHGKVCQLNTHPHTDCHGRIAVVHNGIIENFDELRRELISSGHRFISETDTEVIPHLIEEEIKNGCSLEEAIRNIAPKLAGSYAFAAISVDEPGKVVGTRKGCPLVIGIDDRGCYIASDVLAFSAYTRRSLNLQDGEIAVLRPEKVDLYDARGACLSRQFREIEASWAEGDTNGYPHFMLKEIMEQPAALERCVSQDREQFAKIALDILRARQVVMTACGSSRYAALVGRYLFSRVGRKFSDVVMASEFGYFSDSIDKGTLVLAISQSGETADVIEGVKLAREAGAQIISIVNRPSSLLSELSHQVINLNCGPEIGVAATKTFLCQLAVFYLLAFAMVNSFDDAFHRLMGMKSKVLETLDSTSGQLSRLASRLKDSKDFYYIARGINFAIASEGALKLKEIAYVHAEGMPAGELKHGTLALIEEGTPVLAICPADYTYRETLSNAIEAKSRGAFIIGVSDRHSHAYDFWVRVPQVEEILYPLVTVVPLQLLAYHTAVAKGLNPDKPRNLAKSVTVK